jgi:putative hydrolase of the HAD superfamily
VVASGQIGYAKPEAEAYEITADKLGVSLSECVMIDDRDEYVNAAVGIGMKGIVYNGIDDLRKELKDILKP